MVFSNQNLRPNAQLTVPATDFRNILENRRRIFFPKRVPILNFILRHFATWMQIPWFNGNIVTYFDGFLFSPVACQRRLWGVRGDLNVEVFLIKNSRIVVVLPDSFRGMGARRNSTEAQQLHASRSGPEVKNGSSAKDGAPKRLRCGTIQEEAS